MTRRKQKTWKRILVMILTFAIIAGNLSSQVVVVKAAETGEPDNLEQIYDPETEPVEEPEPEPESEPEPEPEPESTQIIQSTDGDYLFTTVSDDTIVQPDTTQPGTEGGNTDETGSGDGVPTETGETVPAETEGTAIGEDEISQTFLVKYLFPGNTDENYPDREKEFGKGDVITFPETEESYKWEWETRDEYGYRVRLIDEETTVTEDLVLFAVLKQEYVDVSEEPVVDEDPVDGTNTDESEEIVQYTVAFYDADGKLISEALVDENAMLVFPASVKDAVWKDADGKTYDADDLVTSDLSLYAEVEETENEEDTEEIDGIVVKAVCVDEEGVSLPGYDFVIDETITFDDKTVPSIEGYTYVEATIDGVTVSGITVTVDEEGTVVYTITGTTEPLTEDTTVTLSYEAVEDEYVEPAITVTAVDKEGKAIEAEVELPDFLGTLTLNDPEKAPAEVEGYAYVEATINGVVVDSLIREAVETEATMSESEDRAFAWSYVAAGETVLIEEDTTITFVYEELPVAINMTATIVDEFGDEIGGKYTDMELPAFDEEGILTLDDIENPPYEKVVIRKLFRKAITYTYVKAMIDNQIISALKQEAMEDGSGYSYAYSSDGVKWVPLKEDTVLTLEYSDGKKSVYTYEDANVSVTATLQHANAIPDDAEFRVTPVTKGSTYDYDAYMSALNANASVIDGNNSDEESSLPKYNEKNTLLYDIAFIAEEVDDEGNGTGRMIEYEPAEGMVNIAISFKDAQLEEGIGAEEAKDVNVIHLPLAEAAKAGSDTTADAGSLSASDIQVEVVNAAVSVEGESVDFNLANFSVTAFTAEGKKSMDPGPSVTYDSVLGEAVNYGVVANEMTLAGHMETNFAVGSMHGNANIQSCKNDGGGAGYTYIGAYDGTGFKMDLNGNSGALMIYTTETAMRNFGFNMTHLNPGDPLSNLQFPSGVIVDYTSMSESAIKAKVSGLVENAKSMSTTLKNNGETAGYDYSEIKDQYNNIIDVASLGTSDSGTYYINFKEGEFPVSNYTIKIKGGQNVVLNIPDSSVSFGQFKLVVDGTEYTTQGGYGEEIVCEKVIFNCPNATTTQTCLPTDGTFLVPYSTFSNNSVAAGYLIANVIDKIGGQEWHCINHNMPIVNPTSFTLNAQKTVDGLAPSSEEDSKFTFKLFSVADDGTETLIETVTNNGGSVQFTQFSNIKETGTYWYKIQETGEVSGYTLDTTVYYAKVVVSAVTSGMVTNTDATVSYYTGSKDGTVVGVPVFNNTTNRTPTSVILGGKKTVNNSTPSTDQQFTFELYQYTKNGLQSTALQTVQNSGQTFSFSGIELDGTGYTSLSSDGNPEYYYLVKEKVESGNYVYDKTQYIAKVTLTKNGTTWNSSVEYFKFNDGETPQIGQGTKVDAIAFNNTQAPDNNTTEYEFKATKRMIGSDGNAVAWPEGATFTFMIEALQPGEGGTSSYITAAGPLPKNKEVTVTRSNSAGVFGTVTFPAIAKNEGLSSGRYSNTRYQCYMYKITEVIPSDADKLSGVTYDATTHYIKVLHNTMWLSNDTSKTWIEVSGSTSLDNCTGTAGDIEFVNSYNQPKTSVTIEKSWTDNQNQDGKRPTEITVRLYADGVLVADKTATVRASEGWRYTFTELPKYRADGKTEIVYTVKEDAVAGYTPTYKTENGVLVIENNHIPETVEVSGTKTWADDNDRDGVRPEKIIVRVWNGETQVGYKEVTAKDGWKWSFDNLPKYENGQLIVYSITEDVIPGEIYTTEIMDPKVDAQTGNTVIDIKNTHNPGKTNVSVQKVWEDGDNQDHLRTDSIQAALYKTVMNADGSVYADKSIVTIDGANAVVTLSDNNEWKHTWLDLPVKEAGRTIIYSVQEVVIPKGYKATVSGNVTMFTIINTHTPELTAVSGSKTWEDNDDQDGIRPESITIELWRKDKTDAAVQTMEVKPDANGNWSFRFENLPKYDNGNLIEYYIKEVKVQDYTSTISNDGNVWTLVNEHIPVKTEVNGSKTWSDDDNRDGVRPSSITIKLWKEGKIPVDSTVVTAENDWSWAFENLPKYENGQLIKYYITEEEVSDYSTNIKDPRTSINENGIDVITIDVENTHTPGKTSVSVKKEWVDDNNRDGIRPANITVQLYKALKNADNAYSKAVPAQDKNGNYYLVVLDANNNWTHTWQGLPAKENGQEILYSVEEVSVPTGYKKEITGDMSLYTITNTHTYEVTSISATKKWDDSNNQDGLRPESITFELYSETEGKVIATQTVNAANNWTYTFTNLPKKLAGEDIIYKINEISVNYYDSTISNDGNVWTVVNNHDTAKVEVNGTKKWEDDQNRDGIRPSYIVIKLWDGGENPVQTAVVTEKDNWKWSFKDLPKYRNGSEIQYSITEEKVADYSTIIADPVYSTGENGTSVISIDVTNEHTPNKTSVSVLKKWEDNNNQDGLRGTSVQVQLYKEYKNAIDATGDNTPVAVGEVVTLDASNNWKFTWSNLLQKENGKLLKYTVDELQVPKGYQKDITGTETSYTIINTHTPALTEVSGIKTWDDSNNQDGKRTAVVIRLLADGVEKDSKTVTEADNWEFKFESLPVYKDGAEIKYTITEDEVEGYTTDISNTGNYWTVKNSYTPETVNVSGTKKWDDAENRDGVRPSSIIVKLMNGNTVVQTQTVTAADNWQWKFEKLPKYANGVQIVYTVEEERVSGYDTVVYATPVINSTTGDVVCDITNERRPDETSVNVKKVWEDGNNQDGLRTAILVQLYKVVADDQGVEQKQAVGAPIELNEANSWTNGWTGLQKNENGTAIQYVVDEVSVPDGYEKVSISGDMNMYVITNKHTPATVSVSGIKTWDDNNNQDGKRVAVTINLLANGKKIKDTTVTAADNWIWSFTDLPKYDAGKEIIYSITENAVTGYVTEIIAPSKEKGTTNWEVKNTHIPETVSVSGTKTWDDNNNQDGVRPDKLVVYLWENGVQTNQSVETNAEKEWKWSFVNLPKYRDGELISYHVTEETVEGYSLTSLQTSTDSNGNVVTHFTNKHTPGQTGVSVSKVWSDDGNRDGLRPDSIQVQLYKTFVDEAGNETDREAEGAVVTLNATNSWSYNWTELPEKENGKTIVYVVDEVKVPVGYSKIVSANDAHTMYTITNTHTSELVDISGTKTWNDEDDRDGKRKAVTINLLADGTEINEVTVTEADNWAWSFTNLPKFRDGGTEIEYTITEDEVEGYTQNITHEGNQWSVENTHITEKISVSGTKTWVDNNNQDGVRPQKIKINLWKGDEIIKSQEVTADSEGKWNWTFTDLPKYENGQLINYTISEEFIETSTAITEDEELGYTASFTDAQRDSNGNIIINITNKHTPGETGVSVIKEWDDNDNQDGKRTTSVQVRLYKTFVDESGNETSRTAITPDVTLSADNNWTHSWTGLPKKENGQTIVYKVDEVDVPSGYEKSVSGDMTMYKITNTLIPELVEISGTKTWKDDQNILGLRPNSITINLLADGTVIQTQTVTAESGWTWKFTDLPKYKAGNVAIDYTVSEDVVDGYTTVYADNKLDVINTLSGTTSVYGVKKWDDNNNQDGKRPSAITVELYADGLKIESRTLYANEDGTWPAESQWSFTNLPKYTDEGVEIRYTVNEIVTVTGYTAEIKEVTSEDGTVLDGHKYQIINKYNPEKTSRSVEKIWIDGNDQDGIRPDRISVQLIGTVVENGVEKTAFTDTATLQASDVAENNWKYTWTDLPVYSNGLVINYTIQEISVEGYTCTTAGSSNFTITNTHIPEKVKYKVSKIWNDDNNRDGIRPGTVSFRIVEVDEAGNVTADTGLTVTLTSDDNFASKMTPELPKYRDGKEIKYSLVEGEITGYQSEISYVVSAGFTAKNTHDPTRVKIKGVKIWNDNEDADGNRPKTLTFELWKNVNNVHEKVDEQTVTNLNGWTCEFNGPDGKGYPEFENGTKIQYYITEANVDGYVLNDEATSIVEDDENNITITLTNDYKPEFTSRKVMKSWIDDNNRDGIRPNAIKVQLYSDKDMTKPYGDVVTLDESNGWSYEWTELPVKVNGEKVEYTVAELKYGEPWETQYVTSYNEDNPFIIENTHKVVTVDIEGAKTWNDDNNRDGIRPESIEIRLLADGVLVENGVKTVTAADEWKWSFTNLPKYADGKEIVYTIEEVITAGTLAAELYEIVVDGYNVINTYIPETVDIEGQKIWDDNDNAAGARPASIVVNLLADGLVVDTMTVTAENNWAYAFRNLRKYLDGKEIVYTVSEQQVEGYTPIIDGYNITNRYTPGYTYLAGNKVWNDGDDVDGLRPNSVTIRLYRDGEMIRTAQANVGNNWTFMFTDLPITAADGHEYVYTITEDGVMGYTSTINGTTVVNTHTPETPPPPPVPPTPPTTPPEDEDVLGARRTRDVLGARRQKAVLGARRTPQTGDEAKMAAWAMAMSASAAACAAWFGFKRREKK